jgi:hypothetical protein
VSLGSAPNRDSRVADPSVVDPPIRRSGDGGLEATAGDVTVDPLDGGELVGGHRQGLGTREQERLAKLAITDGLEPKHHF